jgi:hypothetical protein
MRQTSSRYEIKNTSVIPDGMRTQGRHGQLQLVYGAVDDLSAYGRERALRQRVMINISVDSLEIEYHAKRLSAEGYRAARTYQHIMQRNTSPSGPGQWLAGDKVDASCAKEMALIAHLDAARAKIKLTDEVVNYVGEQGESLLRAILVDRHNFSSAATLLYRRCGKRAASHCAWLFRSHCEFLALKAPWLTQNSFA